MQSMRVWIRSANDDVRIGLDVSTVLTTYCIGCEVRGGATLSASVEPRVIELMVSEGEDTAQPAAGPTIVIHLPA